MTHQDAVKMIGYLHDIAVGLGFLIGVVTMYILLRIWKDF